MLQPTTPQQQKKILPGRSQVAKNVISLTTNEFGGFLVGNKVVGLHCIFVSFFKWLTSGSSESAALASLSRGAEQAGQTAKRF